MSIDFFKNRRPILAESTVIIVTTFFLLCTLWDHSSFSIFMERDLSRAFALAGGKVIFFGPEIPGGGHHAGPFFYWLIAFPLFFFKNWSLVWYEMILLASCGAGLLYYFLRPRFGQFWSFLAIAIFWRSQVIIELLTDFHHSSFAIFFTILVLYGLVQSYTESETKRKYHWYGLCLIFALTLQFHLQIIAIIPVVLIFQFFPQKLKITSLSRKVFWQGIIIMIIPLLPYFIWKLSHTQLVNHSLTISGSGSHTINWLTTLIHPANWKNGDFLLNIGNKISHLLPAEIILCGFAWPLLLSRGKNHIPLNSGTGKIVKILLIVLLISIPPCLVFFVSPDFSQNTLLFSMTLIFLAVTFPLLYISEKNISHYIWLCALTFALLAIKDLIIFPNALPFGPLVIFAMAVPILVLYVSPNSANLLLFVSLSIFSGLTIQKRHMNPFDVARKKINFHETKELSRHMKLFTSNPWEVVRNNFIFYKESPEISFRYPFNQTEQKNTKEVDGFVVIPGDRLEDIQKFQLLKDVKIEISEPVKVGRHYLYWWQYLENSQKSSSINNIGTPYVSNAVLYCGKGEFSQVGDHHWLYRWSPLGEENCYFQLALAIQFKADKTIRVNIFSDSLSQPSPWVAPEGVTAYKKMTITLTCENGNHDIQLFEQIGFSHDTKNKEKHVLAPWSKSFKNPCEKAPHTLTLDWKDTLISRLNQQESFEGQRVNLNLTN